MKRSTHYTNLGVSMQPTVADTNGFVHFRQNFQRLPKETWTAAEVWLFAQEKRIETWRKE